MKNPSERRDGSVRFNALCGSLDAWRAVSIGVAQTLERSGRAVAMRSVLDAMRHPGFDVFTQEVCYFNVRFVRSVIQACGFRIADTDDDWSILRRMSSSMQTLCERWGLGHVAALDLRDAMRATEPEYGLLDLSCFLCLARL